MRGEVLGVERRRRWSDEQKLSILASVGVDGATVTQVAQRHEVTRSQIYGWRYDLKRKGLLPSEAPLRFVSLPTLASVAPEEVVPTAPDETVDLGAACHAMGRDRLAAPELGGATSPGRLIYRSVIACFYGDLSRLMLSMVMSTKLPTCPTIRPF